MGIMSTLNKYLYLFGFLVEFFRSLLLEIIILSYSCSLWTSKIGYFFESGERREVNWSFGFSFRVDTLCMLVLPAFL